MDILEFHQKLSSPNHERIQQYPLLSIIFNMINGSAMKEEEIVGIVNQGDRFEVHFINEQYASYAEGQLKAQIVPGVYDNPLYGIITDCEENILTIRFVEL